MKIVFFKHPDFSTSQSMPRFAEMLYNGMVNLGHSVEVWYPKAKFFSFKAPLYIQKWLGYIDQYIVFPLEVKKRLGKCPPETLFIFIDQALGPWVPLVKNRPHVIHCHDFLAQRSALGQIPENPVSWTGRQYQAFIRRGYKKGKSFISVSEKTKCDLHELLKLPPAFSEVIYNGLNQSFNSIEIDFARRKLEEHLSTDLSAGYLLHIGGNQWYKNRKGVIEIYDAWRRQNNACLPLLMVGSSPDTKLQERAAISIYKNDIFFLSGLDNTTIRLAYAGASVFIFPSLAEGFGWPIAEAMASGCPVITTNEAPMKEVAGNAAFFIPKRPNDENKISQWANSSAHVINKVLNLSDVDRKKIIDVGYENIDRFNADRYIEKIESTYQSILDTQKIRFNK